MQLLWMDLAMQYTASKARELAQHADQEAWEDRCDVPIGDEVHLELNVT